jgi:hypothetical protein
MRRTLFTLLLLTTAIWGISAQQAPAPAPARSPVDADRTPESSLLSPGWFLLRSGLVCPLGLRFRKRVWVEAKRIARQWVLFTHSTILSHSKAFLWFAEFICFARPKIAPRNLSMGLCPGPWSHDRLGNNIPGKSEGVARSAEVVVQALQGIQLG